jgi:hypothetical protein
MARVRTGISFFMGCAFNAPPFDAAMPALFDGLMAIFAAECPAITRESL